LNIDSILSDCSQEVFWELETGQQRILKFIAKHGPLNSTELGKMNKRYTLPGFDRWGVLNRIKGSNKFLNLLKYDYLIEIPINKKETTYGLTLKGLMYSLSFVHFEDHYLIKRYIEFLKTHLKNPNDIEDIIQFIKYELAYVLEYLSGQGINWKKFLSVPAYLENQREPGKIDSFFIKFEIDLDPENSFTDEIERNYSNLHHFCWQNVEGSTSLKKLIDSDQIFKEWKRFILKGGSFKENYKKILIFNLFCRFWMFAIIEPHFEKNIHELVWLYFQHRNYDLPLKLSKMSKKDMAKFMENGEVRDKLSSMFGFVHVH